MVMGILIVVVCCVLVLKLLLLFFQQKCVEDVFVFVIQYKVMLFSILLWLSMCLGLLLLLVYVVIFLNIYVVRLVGELVSVQFRVCGWVIIIVLYVVFWLKKVFSWLQVCCLLLDRFDGVGLLLLMLLIRVVGMVVGMLRWIFSKFGGVCCVSVLEMIELWLLFWDMYCVYFSCFINMFQVLVMWFGFQFGLVGLLEKLQLGMVGIIMLNVFLVWLLKVIGLVNGLIVLMNFSGEFGQLCVRISGMVCGLCECMWMNWMFMLLMVVMNLGRVFSFVFILCQL